MHPATVLVLQTLLAATPDAGRPVPRLTGDAELAQALLSPDAAERARATQALSKLDSSMVPVLHPSAWHCTAPLAAYLSRQRSDLPEECERYNAAVGHVIEVLTALAPKEPKRCATHDCPGKELLFALARPGGLLDELPLLPEADPTPKALRDQAQRGLDQALVLWKKPPAREKPVAVLGKERLYLDLNTTPPGLHTACRAALYLSDGRQSQVFAVPESAAGCLIERVVAQRDERKKKALVYVELQWTTGGEGMGVGLLALSTRPFGKVLCGLRTLAKGEAPAHLLANRHSLLRVEPSGCELVDERRAEELGFRRY